ncbi:fungal trichothecene efflux pump [Lophiotrema nucula]|uniref:Fungal trichothecene efflux pump n=1 Tax=Lophiotrema nucula TaxID=690887 RepID=A0A6A5Z430_9PLEO|nr:fungal trichothecene efflux pump [Lophiotrema nucula]
MISQSESSPERGTLDEKKQAEYADTMAPRTPPSEEEASDHMSWKTYAGLLSLTLSLNGYLFTQIMPSAVLAFINADLGPDTNYVWISVSWNLVAAVVVTITGRFADIFGRRWFLISGAAISTLGAIVGATSQSINQSIASGVLFGLGGGMQEMVFSCIQELVPNNKRFLTIGLFEFGNLPSMFSALISYSFIAHVGSGWRACYYFCIAVEGAATIMMFIFYHPPSFETKHQLDKKSRLQLVMETDFVGLITFSAACTLLLLAINWGGVLHPWKSAAVIAPIVISGVLFIALGFWEAYADLKHPLLPARLFRRFRDFTAILVVTFVAGMLYYSNLIVWPRLSALVWIPADDIMKRGLFANIANWSTPIAALYGMLIMPWVHHERWQVTGLATLQTAFTGALASVGRNTQGMTIFFLLVAGSAATATNILVFGTVSLLLEDQTDIGVAVGLVSTSRLIGGAIAGAIYTSIYSNRYTSEIPSILQSSASAAGFTGSFSALLAASKLNTAAAYNKVAGMTPAVLRAAQIAVQDAYIKSFRLVFLVAIAFGAVAICSALMTRSVPMERKTGRRAVTMENEKDMRGTAERSA